MPAPVRALTFDVFGTVVDWRGSIIKEGAEWTRSHHIQADWAALADAWRGGYGPSMDLVRTGKLPWMNIDQLHRRILDGLLEKFKISGLSETDKQRLNKVWHRLHPWPDAVAGLTRLKTKHIIATLSNGNVALLTNMAKFGGLPWDVILSAELVKHYKPDPEAYLGACRLLDLPPAEVMMVAAHKNDLRAAARAGLQTAFVARPLERGPGAKMDVSPEPEFTHNTRSFVELAEKLGC
ncbi:MAG: haloacid dehalogenase type II [Acidobacteria bacterium]|nr:haloacid dehalogenase type II [Acidobacteriota bacterium]